MQQQIADELGDRQDLMSPLADSGLTLSPIKNAIQSAIAKWERESFRFNELFAQNLFSTVSGTEFYTTDGTTANQIANAPDLLMLHILISGNRYPLYVRTWEYMEMISANPSVTGNPIDYAFMAGTLRFYPIPDGAYPITLSGTQRLTALAADADTNGWTQDGWDLIRSEAKLILAREVLFDDDLATRMEAAIYGRTSAGGSFGYFPEQRGYLYGLKAERNHRARAKIIPTYFSIAAAALGLVLPVLTQVT
jgi:hypothetical protein